MKKIILILLLVCLFSNCSKQNKKNEAELSPDKLMLEAYAKKDYAKCLEILQGGFDGHVDCYKPDYPLLYDICKRYLNNA